MDNFVPTTRKKLTQWRGPTASSDYNEFIRSSYSDLARLYNLLRVQEETLANNFAQTIKENIILRMKIEELEQSIADLEQTQGELVERFFSEENLFNNTIEGEIPEDERMTIDTIHGIATLPETSSTNKLVYRDSQSQVTLPSSFAYFLFPDEPTAGTLIEGNIVNCLGSMGGVAWERTRVLNSTPSQESILWIYIKIPTDIVSTFNSNCLYLHPYPSFFVDILDVSYSIDQAPSTNIQDIVYANWNQEFGSVPESSRWVIPREGEEYYHQNNARPSRYDFDPEPITALKIKIRQRNYLQEGLVYLVSYGFSFLSLENKKYAKYGRKVIKFTAPGDGVFRRITGVSAYIYNQPLNVYGDITTARLFYENSGIMQQISLGETITSDPTEIFVEISLYETPGGGTPALTGIKLEYDY